MERKVQRLPTYPLPQYVHGLPISNVPHQSCTRVSLPEPKSPVIVTQSLLLTRAFTPGGVHSLVWTEVSQMTCVHLRVSYRVVSNSLKILLLHLFIPPPSPTPATTDLFTVSIVLPFPESHRAGIVQYAAFSDWFLSLSNTHLVFSMSFCVLIAHSFSAPNIILCPNVPQFTSPFTY